MADDRARLRDRPVLVVAAVGLAVGELAMVNLLGPHTALASAPQVSAPGLNTNGVVTAACSSATSVPST